MLSKITEQWLSKRTHQLQIAVLCMAVGVALASHFWLVRTATAQSAQPTFVLHATLPISNLTNAIAVGDLNGDGSLDLVAGNTGQSYVYFNDEHGNFNTPIAFGGIGQTVDVVVADVNGDGALDIIAYNWGTPSVIYLNDGSGHFHQYSLFDSASGPHDKLAIGDINGDGTLDIVAAHELGQSIIYLNNGQGTFTRARTLRPGLSPVLIDFNGDGNLDLIMIHPDINQPLQSHLYFYQNDGAGNFAATMLNLSGSKGFDNKFAVGDINGDGKMAFVISSVAKTGCTGTSCEDLRLMVNRGVSGYTATHLDDAGASDIALVDLDNDGKLDIATTGLPFDTQRANDRQDKVYMNNGVNQLTQTVSFVDTLPGPTA